MQPQKDQDKYAVAALRRKNLMQRMIMIPIKKCNTGSALYVLDFKPMRRIIFDRRNTQ